MSFESFVCEILTEAARGNLIPTDVSKKQNRFNRKQMVVSA